MKFSKNIKTPKTVLAVFAHPDDIDFSSSGTIAKWVKRGAAVTYLVCTDGGKGSDDPLMTSRKLASIRKKEQLAAARILAVKEVIFINYRDGELTVNLELKERICRVIRRTKPETVITLDPLFFYSITYGFINHTDHRAAGEATIDAVYPLARDRLNFPQHEKEGYIPHKVKTLLLVSFENASHFEDISETFSQKISAIKAHQSQLQPDSRLLAFIRRRALVLGKQAKFRYAEGFKRLELPE